MIRFEWDDVKAATNLEKHGVSFEEASAVFFDPRAVTIDDPDHSIDERREITVGLIGGRVILMLSHTDRNGIIRIISARKANPREKRRYEQF